MTIRQVEEKITELVHREPIAPFVVEQTDGRIIEVLHPRLAFDDSGPVFIGPDGGFVDFEFASVGVIRFFRPGAVA
jgi:hypothetical protein